ncbi:MAG: response regulator transcription factor [Oscillospiraceae bacterium]|jgi:DNA-binding response OmpR family regulator|nr:response regulator transcription factor [Oscillospiraceae bacterium]
MVKVLIVEDDIHISEMLCELLRQNNYAPSAAYSGTEALLLLSRDSFSVVLLDLMLPGKTGEQVLEELRTSSAVPVIVLTARTDKETTVRLLRLGADDYIAKPFDNGELLARIAVQLRRAVPQKRKNAQIRFKDIILDLDRYDALAGGQKAGLSKREFEILRLMMTYPGKVFTKNNLYESVWGGEFLGDDNTVNVHISKLRAKLNAISPGVEYVQTVWGIGFKMKE